MRLTDIRDVHTLLSSGCTYSAVFLYGTFTDSLCSKCHFLLSKLCCAVLCCAAEYAVLLAKYFIALHIQLTTLLMSTDDSTHSSENSEHNKTALPCQQQFDFSALSVRGLRCAARDVKQADKRLVSLLGFLFSTFFYFKLLIKNNNCFIQ